MGGEGEGGIQLLICSPSPGPVHYIDDFGSEDGTIWHHSHSLPFFPLPPRNSRLMRTRRSVAICLRVSCVFAGAAARRAARCPWTAPSSATPARGRSSTSRFTTPAEKVSERHSEKRIPPRRHSISLYSLSNLGGRGPQRPNSFVLPNAMEVICFGEGVL